MAYGFSSRNNVLNSYLSDIRNLINTKDGDELAVQLSLEKFNPPRDFFAGSNNQMENAIKKMLDSPWDEIVFAHLLSYQTLMESSQDYTTAFNHKCSMVQAVVKLLTQIKEDNWMLPIVYVTSIELRKLAICADCTVAPNALNKQVKPDANIEEAASQLMNCFRVCATDSRTAIEYSKRKAMMNIINQLFKIYFRINKLNLYKPLVRAVENNANIMEHFTLAERVTYSYFTGMKSLYDSDYRTADNLLTYAFQNCHPQYFKNRKIILIFLIPVKMLFAGTMPTSKLLSLYDLPQFEELCEAIKDGNLYSFDQAIEKHADFFYLHGIYFTLEKLKGLVYRNIFKKVAKIVDKNQIEMDKFVDAINYFQSNRGKIELKTDQKVTTEEVHCLLANLIAANKLKGYISLQHQKLVISKQNPFPKLSSIN